jgi:hypothetical protein
MLREYLPETDAAGHTKEEIIYAVKRDEAKAAQLADVNVAVTQEDLKQLHAWNEKKATLLLPNGSYQIDRQIHGKSLEDKLLETTGGRDFGLFIGSGHPPNLNGFSALVGENLSHLPPNFILVCAGSVSHGIKNYLLSGFQASLNSSRLALLDDISNTALTYLRSKARYSILPIQSGGGSNLKTAEALLSPGAVIASTTAFRGYEDRQSDPGVFIADSRESFRDHMSKCATNATLGSFSRESSPARPLTWEHALVPLSSLIH